MKLLYQKLRRMKSAAALLLALALAVSAACAEAPLLQRLRFADWKYLAFEGQVIRPEPDVYPDVEVPLYWTSSDPFVADYVFIGHTAVPASPESATPSDLPAPAGPTEGIECRQVGTADITCAAQDGSGRSAHFRLIVEPEIPVGIEEVRLVRGRLALRLKNRMWETMIQGMTVEIAYLDAEGNEIAVQEAELSGFKIRAAKRGEVSLPPEPPEGAETWRIAIRQIRNWEMSYDLPRTEEELNRGAEALFTPPSE